MSGDLTGFLSMGGYAGYVWPAYLLTLVVLAALGIATVHGLRQKQKTLALLQATVRPGRRRPREASAQPPSVPASALTEGDTP